MGTLADKTFHGNGQIDIYRTPDDWRDIGNETQTIINSKIRRAKELGVVAVLFNAGQVRDRVEALAMLESQVIDPAKRNVYVALQGGAVPFVGQFFPQLRIQAPDHHPFVKYMEVSRYKDKQTGSATLEIIKDLDPEDIAIADSFTIVDEVGDLGDTVEAVRLHLATRHQEITGRDDVGMRLILLSDKNIATYPGFDHDNVHRGLIVPEPWIAGMGMDGSDEWHRWDPEISLSRVQKEEYRKQMPAILDILGDRAVLGMDDITWIPS